MDKTKIIQALNNIPEEWIKNAYSVSANEGNYIQIQMRYNFKLVKELISGNKWESKISDNGFMILRRNDGLEITMT